LFHDFSLENKKPAAGLRPPGDHWSGEATRTQGFAVEEARVDVMIGGDEGIQDQTAVRKERPIWMTESTIINQDSVMVSMQICLITIA
jgi:transcription initiation factor TFIIE subunit alpha